MVRFWFRMFPETLEGNQPTNPNRQANPPKPQNRPAKPIKTTQDPTKFKFTQPKTNLKSNLNQPNPAPQSQPEATPNPKTPAVSKSKRRWRHGPQPRRHDGCLSSDASGRWRWWWRLGRALPQRVGGQCFGYTEASKKHLLENAGVGANLEESLKICSFQV